MQKQYQVLIYFIYLLVFSSCAQIVSPTGGDKDEDPPVLDTLKSTQNFQTNFKKQDLEFWFDEWVQIKDVFTQVVTSPPLRYDPPEIFIRNKSVRVRFDEREVLKENATYTINFGEAIQDITESNPTDLRFVFSTGDYIDSLSIGGKIQDSFTGEPLENIILMLYDNTSDTVVRTERPFYFAKTDEAGSFKIENVRADTFKIFALEDLDLNLLYSQSSEKIGFIDSLIIVNDSLQPQNLKLSLFQETLSLKLQDDIQDEYGILRLSFNREPYDAQINYLDFGQKVIQEVKEDSLLFWYDDPSGGDWEIYFQDGENIDTLEIKGFSKEEFLTKDSLFLENKRFGKQKVNPTKKAKLTFNHPISSFDTSKIFLLQDTTNKRVIGNFEIDTIEVQNLNLSYKWKENLEYSLQLLPSAITDIYGLENKDTIEIKYEIAPIKSFGNINLVVDSLLSENAYVFELLIKEEVIETLQTEGKTSFKHNFIALPPGNYSLRIIEDLDKNGRWSPGNYNLKKQSERVFEKTIEELRANWDVDAEVVLEL